jgi:hypothetical protein
LERGTGDPERSRHLAAALVLYHARPSGWTPYGHAERRRLATELERHDLAVVQGSSSESSGRIYTFSPGLIMP